jgi:hypothetical protein
MGYGARLSITTLPFALAMHALPFVTDHIEAVTALWLELHPDWLWVTDEEFRKSAFEMDEDRVGFIVEDEAGRLVGTVFGTATRDPTWPRNRYLHLELKPEAVREDLLTPLLTQMADSDHGRPGTWQILNLSDKSPPGLAEIVLGTGFELHDISFRMEWNGETVPLVEPAPLRLELYQGGNEATDAELVDLHNRAYRPARLVGPTKIEHLWPKAWPGLKEREFVLVWDGERIAGFAEWFSINGEAIINSIVAARPHWGTHAAPAAGTRAMQRMIDHGYRPLVSAVSSRNAASYKLQYRHGWRRVRENSRNYVRKF